ncbi:MAG: DUF2202 domain-containing protein [Lentimicrobium sp.]|nr:DUF2202 domain-containing protein [Lentimicrobium sp.]
MSGCNSTEEDTTAEVAVVEKAFLDAEILACNAIFDSMPLEPLSETEIDALTHMREEEFLAHDVYMKLAETYTIRIFTNISGSELQHTNAVARILQKYNLPDPGLEHQAGIFVNQELQGLYNALIAQGQQSQVDALTVGATIEDLDIKDLMDLTEVIDNQDINFVFANLTKGSRNHLRAFSAQLKKAGVIYTPQFISAALYQLIISSPHERGCVTN